MRTRTSAQREALMQCLRATREHPSAARLFARLRRKFPKLSLGTVYRNLDILRRQGLVQQLAGNRNEARFDGDLRPHAHFFCVDCGRMFDIPLALAAVKGLTLPAGVGHRPTGFRLEWQGICRDCRSPKPI